MRLIHLITLGFIMCLSGLPAYAQEVTQEPICVNVINKADFSIYGFLRTDFYTRPDGNKGRHTSNFRLEANGTKHEEGYPLDRAEFCASGPFFPGHRLEFVLRTLIPLFSCKTALDQGDIVITGTHIPGQGVKVEATCY